MSNEYETAIADTIPNTCTIVDTTSIYVRMEQFNSRPTRTILIDNRAGRQRVDYQMSIRFVRSITDPEGLSAQDGAYAGLLNPSDTEADSTTRVIRHVHERYLSFAYGLQDIYRPLTIATKYKADTGFNATSVGVWFIGDYMSEGVIQAEVRAGGTSIDDAVPLATGVLQFSISEELNNGRMYSIPLSRTAAIYPNEDYYVIITYPSGQTRPQGCAINQIVESSPNRYLIKSGDKWEDLQQMQGFTNGGWLTNVGGSNDDNIAWLVPQNRVSGSITAGSTGTVGLMFRGSNQLKGQRYAEVTVSINDSCHTKEIIPVTLHTNEAPFFLNAPQRVVIPENSVQTFEIEIYDNENKSFKLEPVAGAKVASYKLSGRKLTLKVVPLTGDAGIYNIKFRVTDSNNESRDLDIPIYVTVLEQLFDPVGLVFPFMGASVTYSVSDLFRYINGSGYSYIVTVKDEKIVKLERLDAHTIELTPDELGTTFIDFAFLDDYGNVLSCAIPATVGQCEDPSRIIVQKWNNILLVNNFSGMYSDEGYQWYMNKQPIPRATGQYYSADATLDFSASYFVRLVTIAGDTIYSCPLTPEFRTANATMRAYPNPILKGEFLTIETGSAFDNIEEVFVQLLNFNGHTVLTNHFKGTTGTLMIDKVESGYYILRLSCKNKNMSFGIFVK